MCRPVVPHAWMPTCPEGVRVFFFFLCVNAMILPCCKSLFASFCSSRVSWYVWACIDDWRHSYLSLDLQLVLTLLLCSRDRLFWMTLIVAMFSNPCLFQTRNGVKKAQINLFRRIWRWDVALREKISFVCVCVCHQYVRVCNIHTRLFKCVRHG